MSIQCWFIIKRPTKNIYLYHSIKHLFNINHLVLYLDLFLFETNLNFFKVPFFRNFSKSLFKFNCSSIKSTKSEAYLKYVVPSLVQQLRLPLAMASRISGLGIGPPSF